MNPSPSIPEKIEGQIAEQVKYLHECEQFLEQATKELVQAPYNEYLERRVRILADMIFNTKHTIQSLERMLKLLQ